MKKVDIYTDGACSGNPGPGGYGALLRYADAEKRISGGFKKTTNNRMEIYAAIAGLEALKTECDVTLYSDSKYLVDAITKGWVTKWKKNGWMRNKTSPALNRDLWERLLIQLERHKVTFVWVKGHADNEGNQICDLLATTAIKKPGLEVDAGYVK